MTPKSQLKDDLQSVKDHLADISQKIDALSQKFDQLDSQYIKNNWSSLEQVLISSGGGFFDDVAKTPYITGQFSTITDQISALQSQISALASKVGGS